MNEKWVWLYSYGCGNTEKVGGGAMAPLAPPPVPTPMMYMESMDSKIPLIQLVHLVFGAVYI